MRHEVGQRSPRKLLVWIQGGRGFCLHLYILVRAHALNGASMCARTDIYRKDLPMTYAPLNPGTYHVDPSASWVDFTTTHLFGLGKVTGRMTIDAGEISVAETPASSTISLVASASSFDTGNPARDKAVKSKRFLDAIQHPVISYSSSELKQDGDHWLLTGELNVLGQSAPLVVRIGEVASDSAAFSAKAAGVVDRYALGVTKAKGMAGRRLEFTVTIQAQSEANGEAAVGGSSSANPPKYKESAR